MAIDISGKEVDMAYMAEEGDAGCCEPGKDCPKDCCPEGEPCC